jgi:uncharacterized membrane protein YgdD (TMEM256/DUF423 family)
MERAWLALGAAFGLLGVLAGAAGAHALESTLEPDALDTFEMAARFQMYHALALLAVGLLAGRWQSALVNAAGWLFTLGVLLFSGSLHILALTDVGVFGAIAPVGGVCLMAGWVSLVAGAIRGARR